MSIQMSSLFLQSLNCFPFVFALGIGSYDVPQAGLEPMILQSEACTTMSSHSHDTGEALRRKDYCCLPLPVGWGPLLILVPSGSLSLSATAKFEPCRQGQCCWES
jgi:hypothetical protein